MLSVYFGYLHGKDMLFPHITFCRSFHNHFKDNLDHNQLHKMMTPRCIHSQSSDLSKLLSELSPPSLSGSQNNSSNICMHHESSPLLRGIIQVLGLLHHFSSRHSHKRRHFSYGNDHAYRCTSRLSFLCLFDESTHAYSIFMVEKPTYKNATFYSNHIHNQKNGNFPC